MIDFIFGHLFCFIVFFGLRNNVLDKQLANLLDFFCPDSANTMFHGTIIRPKGPGWH